MSVVTVGYFERTLPTSEGDVRSTIWYPAGPAMAAEPYLRVYPAGAAHAATPRVGAFPLVLLMAGSGGNRYSHSYLAEGLANRGWWVVAPELPRPIRESQSWHTMRRQARAIRDVVHELRHSDTSLRLDGRGPIWIGHSIGATLGLILAGARPDRHGGRWAAPGFWSAPRLEPDMRALVMLDPALSAAFSPATLSKVDVPSAVFASGVQDADLFGWPGRYRDHLGNVILAHEFPDAGHFAYCNPCPPLLARISPRACRDERIDRAVLHTELLERLGDFLSPWLTTPVCEAASATSKGTQAA
jgi:predicted dienelactone hydrolase